jgi:hypothetical protein
MEADNVMSAAVSKGFDGAMRGSQASSNPAVAKKNQKKKRKKGPAAMRRSRSQSVETEHYCWMREISAMEQRSSRKDQPPWDGAEARVLRRSSIAGGGRFQHFSNFNNGGRPGRCPRLGVDLGVGSDMEVEGDSATSDFSVFQMKKPFVAMLFGLC